MNDAAPAAVVGNVLPILQEDDVRLRKMAQPIAAEDLHEYDDLVADMVRTMLECGGVGLAAPQVGRNVRIIVVNMGEYQFAAVNPVIVERKGEQTVLEGCLSVGRGRTRAKVRRAAKIRVEYMDHEGKQKSFRAKSITAQIVQHEIDHLNGVLFTDYAKPRESVH